MQPDQASFLLRFQMSNLQREHATTRKIIETVPLDKSEYRPDPVAMSALDLCWHIAATENRFLRAVIEAEFKFGNSARPDSVRDTADIARWYTETFEKNFNELSQLPGEQLAKVVDFRGIMQLPAVAFLTLCMHHTIHHRGQLSVYLRPMGAKVPAIYGESYDAAQARLAAIAS